MISEYIVCISDSQKCVNTLKKEMGMIDRDIHLKRLIALKHNGMIKIVTGIRRCGKSTLLFKLFAEHLKQSGVDEKHIVKVDLEDRIAILQQVFRHQVERKALAPVTIDRGESFFSLRRQG